MYLNNVPGVSQLTQNYQNNFEKVSSFFAGNYTQWENYFKKAKDIHNVDRPFRDEFADILHSQNKQFLAGEKTFENIEKLRDAKTLVVATGQQVGLFSGPLYTIYKALTTIKLAQQLSLKLSINVVPVFYIVSEDHDFAEVQWVGLIDKTNNYKKIVYEHPQKEDRVPVADIELLNQISDLLLEIKDTLAQTEFSESIFNLINDCYSPGTKFHVAFSLWFQKLFKKHGIIIFDSSDSRAKEFVNFVFERELREQITFSAMEKTNQELLKKGYHIQIPVIQNRPALFILKDGRHSLLGDGENYKDMNSGKEYSVEDLFNSPQSLSPKAPLRTIVEDVLFPTIAYVGGPGEINYWAQLKGVYQQFDLHMPIVFPRAGFTLVEPKIKRLLQKFNINVETFLQDKDKVLEELGKKLLPKEIAGLFLEMEQSILDQFIPMEKVVNTVDPTLKNVHSKALQNIKNQLYMLQQKTLKAVQNKEKIVGEQIKTLSENLLPENIMQERKLNVLNFLTKYDFALLDRLYDEIDIENPGHKILEL
jgi:bacillithiol synthase